MRCHWFQSHASSVGFDTNEEEGHCRGDHDNYTSHCRYIDWPWPNKFSVGWNYVEENDFLIFLWKQEMGIK